jgi:arylsulfatase A-like enzyme
MIAAVSVVFLFQTVAFGQTTATTRPNIVLILADDLGYSDLSCWGSEIHTPNIDSLAKQGVAFTQFYNQARCCPTRAAIMTGRYPHQVGIAAMIDEYSEAERKAANSPAYQDHLSPDSPTVAELLRPAGYTTLMAGKWHLGSRPAEWPVHRGFDHSFVQIRGAMNYFGGPTTGPREPMAIDDQPWTPPQDGFYSTDAFTDHAIEFVDAAAKTSKPFFLYLPYNAPHWPLQAPPADIQKYAGVYDHGFQPIREQRLKHMIELGILPPGSPMAPMDTGRFKAWEDMTPERHKDWTGRMQVYAAQIDHMDQQIGRLLAELNTLHLTDNTLVIFLSDNGGANEDPNKSKPGAVIGTRDSYRGYDRPWATVSNTPWRLHKTTCYEGGISTPLVARWPAGIPTAMDGTYIRPPAHVIDLLPTFLELAGTTYPVKPGGPSPEGHSILPLLQGRPDTADRVYFWEHEGNRGIRDGRWKLVMLNDEPGGWHLYDMNTDRVESHNLAAEKPEIAKELTAKYDAWAARVGVQPWTELREKAKEEAGR